MPRARPTAFELTLPCVLFLCAPCVMLYTSFHRSSKGAVGNGEATQRRDSRLVTCTCWKMNVKWCRVKVQGPSNPCKWYPTSAYSTFEAFAFMMFRLVCLTVRHACSRDACTLPCNLKWELNLKVLMSPTLVTLGIMTGPSALRT